MYARRTMMALTLAALLIWAGGCDDGALTPDEGSLFLTVSPKEVSIDLAANQVSAQSSIIVQLFGATDLPIKDASVVITSEGGTLVSQSNLCVANRCSISQSVCVIDGDCPPVVGVPRLTDAEGYVRETLILRPGDPSSVEITVQSGSLVQSETVSLIVEGLPQAQAVLSLSPEEFGCVAAMQSVELQGGNSRPGAGEDAITCYQFTILPLDGDPVVIRGDDASPMWTPTEDTVVDVVLQVSDQEIDCPRSDQPLADPSLLSPLTAEIRDYPIDGARPDAVAVIAGGANAGTVGNAVTVSASGSTDVGSGIASYAWDCDISDTGSGGAPIGSSASCTYSQAGTFTIRLTVTDGCGIQGSTEQEIDITAASPSSAR